VYTSSLVLFVVQDSNDLLALYPVKFEDKMSAVWVFSQLIFTETEELNNETEV
jgi:hypothetical protein